MKKFLKAKSLMLISILLICFFGTLGVVAVNAENSNASLQEDTAVITVEDQGEIQQVSNDETETLKTYEDNSLNKMSSAETLLMGFLSVLIVVELIGTAVLIVLILKKSKNT